MKSTKLTLILIILSLHFQAVAQSKTLPNVVVLATGGTIAGAAETGTQASYTSGKVTIDKMIDAVPNIRDLANITGEQVSNVGSQDMSEAIWMKLAKRINELLSQGNVDGIVITHGTDTEEETAYFLDLVVKSDKPVVITGSMRPSTAVSAEGPLNLYNSVAVAADPKSKGYGVMLVMNDQIFDAHSSTKTNTTSVQTFQSPTHGPMGAVLYGQVEFYRKPHGLNTTASEFYVSENTILPRVDIIYTYVGCPTDMLDAAIKNGAKGVIIAGVGNGNMSKEMLDKVKTYTSTGIPIVRSTRVLSGYVLHNAEVNDDDYHTIASDELNPQKSRILLMLALLKKRDNANIQKLFYDY